MKMVKPLLYGERHRVPPKDCIPGSDLFQRPSRLKVGKMWVVTSNMHVAGFCCTNATHKKAVTTKIAFEKGTEISLSPYIIQMAPPAWDIWVQS